MWISVGNLHCVVLRADDAERAWLVQYLSFEDSRARFYKGAGKNQPIRMVNQLHWTFPAGLLPLVQKAAADAGFTVDTRDDRRAPCQPDQGADLVWLRDYQREAVDAAVNRTRGILWLPTAAGKTEVAVGLTRALPCRWLFVVHRAQLAYDAGERHARRSATRPDYVQAGFIGEGQWNNAFDHGGNLVCATFQSLYAGIKNGDPRVRKLLDQTDALMVDECHVLPADSFWKVIMSVENAYYRIGLSGTPLARGDRRSVLAIAALGPPIYRLRSGRLIEEGVLAKPTIRLVPVVQTTSAITWQGVYGECIVRSATRNRAVASAARRAEKPCLVFVQQVEHGRRLLDTLQRDGLAVEFVDGKAPLDARRSAVTRLERGDIDVLICTVIFQEGIDIPYLQSVVIAAGGQSIIAALQRIGRGMRTRAPDGSTIKTTFEVWDFDDRGHRSLEKHSRARKRAYTAEGYETTIEDALITTKRVRKTAVAT